MGPLISAAHRDTVASFLDGARRRVPRLGARAATGFWFAPAVVLADPRRTAIAQEEVFGPVVAVLPFDDEADAHPPRERHDLRPRRLDLDREPRPRGARLARRQERRAVGQLALVGALLRRRSAA